MKEQIEAIISRLETLISQPESLVESEHDLNRWGYTATGRYAKVVEGLNTAIDALQDIDWT